MINYYIPNNFKTNGLLFKDSEFQQSRKCLEAAMKDSASKGLISGVNRSKAISNDQENHLWNCITCRTVLGKSTPQQLTHTIVYLIGIHFNLRGGKELRRLRIGDNAQI